MTAHVSERLERHRKFWKHASTDRLLVGFTIGSYFPVHRFNAAQGLLQESQRIWPAMVAVEDYLEDYERLYRLSEEVEQDLFWVAEPFTGIPWMEAMLGCEIRGASDSIWAAHWLDDLEKFPDRIDLDQNPWFQKYMEFVQRLVQHSRGRFAVGQPIFRGPVDMLAALRGHDRAVLDFFDTPEQTRRVLQVATETFVETVRRHQAAVPRIQGGYAIGFYDIWCPAQAIWLQEDSSALLNPTMYREFIFPLDHRIAGTFDYSLFHLHPASLFVLDHLLEMDPLKVIQINKDVGGPSISAMIPTLAEVLRRKCLLIWGALDSDEVAEIVEGLSPRGLALHLVVESVEAAGPLMEVIRSRSKPS
ncbi:MAG: hypothetical protein JSW39_00485 [Desulfobacterales bacterium]|nr:MAG: hypothetical protein JSW39_00485 [Desulfobacterales bacterium]